MNYTATNIKDIYGELKTSEKGLTQKEAEKRLRKFGLNQLIRQQKISAWKILLAQFSDFLVLILIAAAGISYFSSLILPSSAGSSNLDTLLIIAILVANGIFGFIQNYKAEQSIEHLRKMATTSAIVLREGGKVKIDARQVVPGDILILEEGDLVPADARILESNNLTLDESNLTGESVPSHKVAGILKGKLPLGDQKNMVFMSLPVVRGSGRAVVVETGMSTQIGHIAKKLEETEDRPSPFQVELGKLGKNIGLTVIFLAILITSVQLMVVGLSVESFFPIFIFGASLAVAAVPEGLPAVVTVGLAIGSKRMAKKKALVRHLAVVESLGSVDVICTDKTGTLTENAMTVRKLYADGNPLEITALKKKLPPHGALSLMLKTGVLCNNAELHERSKNVGDPTEIALLVSAQKAGLSADKLTSFKRLSENTFSSERKMMSVICRNGKDQFLFAKGAPEMILKKCSTILINGRERPLTEKDKKEILAKSDSFAAEALRILGFAYQKNTREEKGLVFLGLQGMIDPPRKEVAKALKECREAGIRVVMITGDHPGTAIAIARELGLPSEKILTGMELDQLNEKELKATLKEVSVFARVNPEHKVKILKLLQEDHLVAMTGDGVNDAPALKQADIGISMGIRGTEVAKEASDMILLDDNFATIRSAIREGRGIFDNIRKFVNYLLSANAGEVSLIFFAIIYGRIFQASSGLLIPLMAVHLLWINLLTDGFPALALAVDPISKNVMKRPPKPRSEGVINRPVAFSVIIIGFVLGLIGLAVFLKNLDNLMKAQTMAFTTLVILELAKIEHIRARYKLSLLSNRWLIGAIALSLSLQLLVLYSPLGSHFGVLPLSLADWGQIGIALVAFLLASKIISFWQDYLFPGNHN